VRPIPRQRPITLRTRTLCHGCAGTGAIARPRWDTMDGECLAHGTEWAPCPDCEGEKWLAGITPPA
jgi:hypothetical protein